MRNLDDEEMRCCQKIDIWHLDKNDLIFLIELGTLEAGPINLNVPVVEKNYQLS